MSPVTRSAERCVGGATQPYLWDNKSWLPAAAFSALLFAAFITTLLAVYSTGSLRRSRTSFSCATYALGPSSEPAGRLPPAPSSAPSGFSAAMPPACEAEFSEHIVSHTPGPDALVTTSTFHVQHCLPRTLCATPSGTTEDAESEPAFAAVSDAYDLPPPGAYFSADRELTIQAFMRLAPSDLPADIDAVVAAIALAPSDAHIEIGVEALLWSMFPFSSHADIAAACNIIWTLPVGCGLASRSSAAPASCGAKPSHRRALARAAKRQPACSSPQSATGYAEPPPGGVVDSAAVICSRVRELQGVLLEHLHINNLLPEHYVGEYWDVASIALASEARALAGWGDAAALYYGEEDYWEGGGGFGEEDYWGGDGGFGESWAGQIDYEDGVGECEGTVAG